MLSLTRARSHAGIFAAVAAVVALVTGLIVALLCVLAVAADDGVRMGLASRSGSDLGLRATLPLADDESAQDAVVRAGIARAFAALSADPVVVRTVTAEVPFGPLDAELEALILDDEPLTESADIVEGRWASSPEEATMQADSAAALDLALKDEILLNGTPRALVGTWRVTDPLDPRWMSDEELLTGGGSTAATIALAAPTWAGAEPRAEWTIIPDAAALTTSDLDAVAGAWSGLRSTLGAEGADVEGLTSTGGFAHTAEALLAQVERIRALTPVVVLLILAAALVTIAELARLMAASRASEFALLWSRGRSAVEAGVFTAVEGAVAALVGGFVGAACGLAAAGALGARADVVPPASIAALVLALAAVTAIAFGAAAARASRPVGTAATSGRVRRVAAPGVTVLVALAAALSVWQLRLYGSPVAAEDDAQPAAPDPIAVIAPALAILAVVLLLLLGLPFATRALERVSGRSGVLRLLATRSFARRLPRVTAAIAVIAVATGALVTAVAYQATWASAFERTSAIRAGADVQAVASRGGFDTAAIDRVAALPSVQAVFPVQLAVVQLSDSSASLVAADPAALASVAPSIDGALASPSLAEALAVEARGPRIPEGAATVTMTSAVRGFTADPALEILVRESGGRIVRVPAAVSTTGTPDADTSLTAAFDIPPTARDGSAQLVAVDVAVDVAVPEGATVDEEGEGNQAEARFGPPTFTTDAPASSGDLGGLTWSARAGDADEAPTPLTGGGFGARPGVTDVRLLPDVDTARGIDTPPVAVSQALADLYGLAEGDPISFRIERSSRFDAVVAAVVPAIPSADDASALMVDLTVLQMDAVLSAISPPPPTALWVESPDPALAAGEVREALAPGTLIRSADDPAGRRVAGSITGALWAAAALCALLALVTMVAVAASERRGRLPEIGVLRALGARAREQAQLRRGEWAAVVTAGVAIGILAGAVVVLLTIPELANAAVPEAGLGLGAPVRVDLLWLTAGLGLFVLCCAGVVEWVAARVAIDARASRGAVSET